MIAHFLESTVMFQTGDVLVAYAIVFGSLIAMCGAAFFSATKTDIE